LTTCCSLTLSYSNRKMCMDKWKNVRPEDLILLSYSCKTVWMTTRGVLKLWEITPPTLMIREIPNHPYNQRNSPPTLMIREIPNHPYNQRNSPPTLMIREIPHPPLWSEKFPTHPYNQRNTPPTLTIREPPQQQQSI
jgi:hypothetical protein